MPNGLIIRVLTFPGHNTMVLKAIALQSGSLGELNYLFIIKDLKIRLVISLNS